MKTVIFDMDGTLLDSSRAIEISVNNTRRELYGLAPIQRDFIVRTINDPSKNAFLEFYGKTEASAEELVFFEKEFVKNYHEFAVLYDGIDGLLRHCKSSGYFVALASNAPAYTLQEILTKTGSRELFDLVVGADEHTPSKPDPAMLLRTISLSPHKKAIFLGDSKKDELAAIRGAEFLKNLEFSQGLKACGENLSANDEDFSARCSAGGINIDANEADDKILKSQNFTAGGTACDANKANADDASRASGGASGKNFSFSSADLGSSDASASSFKGSKIAAKSTAGDATAQATTDEAVSQTAAGKALSAQLHLADLLGAQLEYLQVSWGFGEPSEISRNARSVEQAREIIDAL